MPRGLPCTAPSSNAAAAAAGAATSTRGGAPQRSCAACLTPNVRHVLRARTSAALAAPLRAASSKDDPLLERMRTSPPARQRAWRERQQQQQGVKQKFQQVAQPQPQQHVQQEPQVSLAPPRQQQQQPAPPLSQRHNRQQRLRKTQTGSLQQQSTHKGARRSELSRCSCYSALLEYLQARQAQQSIDRGTHGQQQRVQQQDMEQQQYVLLLDAAETMELLGRMAALERQHQQQQGSLTGGVTGAISPAAPSSPRTTASSPFAEEQALQQLLPLAYELLEAHAAMPLPVGLAQRDVLMGVAALASLRRSLPSRLIELVEPAGGLGLPRLRVSELAGLASGLARAGARPSNAWLLLLMRAAQPQIGRASLGQLSALLAALVQLGVQPAGPVLDTLQERVVYCLVEVAVRQQVVVGQQAPRRQPHATAPAAMAAAPSPAVQSSNSSSSSGRGSRGSGGGSAPVPPPLLRLHDVAQLLAALAAARVRPRPQLAAALWGATESALPGAEPGVLAELLSAAAGLKLLPPRSWMTAFVTASAPLLPRCKPWQLASCAAALGELVGAGLDCGDGSSSGSSGSSSSSSSNSDGTGRVGDGGTCYDWGCDIWVAALLAATRGQQGAFSARDLVQLLWGVAQLPIALPGAALAPLLAEAQAKLPRLPAAALPALLEAAVELEQRQRQLTSTGGSIAQLAAPQQDAVNLPADAPRDAAAGGTHVQLLSQDWASALLCEASAKLPMLGADELARLLLALGRGGLKPSLLWLEAAAAALAGKLTLLPPGRVVAVVTVLSDLGGPPDAAWLSGAAVALEGRLLELTQAELAALLAALAATQVCASPGFLRAARWAAQQQQHEDIGAAAGAGGGAGGDGALDKALTELDELAAAAAAAVVAAA